MGLHNPLDTSFECGEKLDSEVVMPALERSKVCLLEQTPEDWLYRLP